MSFEREMAYNGVAEKMLFKERSINSTITTTMFTNDELVLGIEDAVDPVEQIQDNIRFVYLHHF